MMVSEAKGSSRLLALLRTHHIKVRFVGAGGLNTVFGLAIYPVLMWVLSPFSVHYLIVLTIAQALSIVFAFLTNKFLVFQTRGRSISEFGKFAAFHLGYFAANLVALPVLVEVGGAPPVLAQLSFALAVIVSSYFWHSRITFHSRSSEL